MKHINITLFTLLDLLPAVTATGQRTEKKIIKVECCQNYADPIYLRWKNSKGGVDSWLFDKVITDNYKANTVTSYEKVISNLTSGDKLQVTKKEAADSFICYCEFDKKNLKAFKQLLRSELVQMLVDVTNLYFINVDIEQQQLLIRNDTDICKLIIKIICPSYER